MVSVIYTTSMCSHTFDNYGRKFFDWMLTEVLKLTVKLVNHGSQQCYRVTISMGQGTCPLVVTHRPTIIKFVDN